ncbi:MAG: hypothetical protein CL606_05050 [Anaerolineaceae bacterium]|nr:hypothetical protein [Anaerolineaceae bacterium]|tara:strand:+ start:73694 stop:74884 length:1191 start_codon:yes stop_codon:yes gene_type:complete
MNSERSFLRLLENTNTKLPVLVFTALLTTTLMIMVGSIVRVTGHGLGCPDWPLCYGQAIPPLGDISAWIEFSHRFIGLIVALQFVLILLVVWRYHRNSGFVFWPSLLANVFLLIQIFLGGIHVILEIPPATGWIHTGNALMLLGLVGVLFVAVAYSMTWRPDFLRMEGKQPLLLWATIITVVLAMVHIYLYRLYGSYESNACPIDTYCASIIAVGRYMTVISVSVSLIIALLYFVNVSISTISSADGVPTEKAFYRFVTFTLVTLYLLLLSGSYVTRSGASLACLEFPHCGEVSDAITELVNIHLIHRYLALVVGAMLLLVSYMLINVYASLQIRYFGHSLLVLLVVQVVLGAANILLRIPMWSRVLHLTVGAALWTCLAMLWAILAIRQTDTLKY